MRDRVKGDQGEGWTAPQQCDLSAPSLRAHGAGEVDVTASNLRVVEEEVELPEVELTGVATSPSRVRRAIAPGRSARRPSRVPVLSGAQKLSLPRALCCWSRARSVCLC